MVNSFEEGLVQRIRECDLVVTRLETDPAWKIILKDLSELRKQIDDGWQEINDDKKLERARVMKFAIQHLMDITTGYKSELIAAQEELKKIQEPEKETMKDYDLDTKTEGEE